MEKLLVLAQTEVNRTRSVDRGGEIERVDSGVAGCIEYSGPYRKLGGF